MKPFLPVYWNAHFPRIFLSNPSLTDRWLLSCCFSLYQRVSVQWICERGLLGRPPPSTRQYTRPPFPIWSSALQTSNCRPHHTCPSSPRSALQDTHVHAKLQQVPGRKPEAFPMLSVRTSLPSSSSSSSSSSLTCRRSISTLQTYMLICVSH